MYKRDFAVVLLSAFAIYFSVQRQGPVSFRQSWYYQTDGDQDLEQAHDVLCPPVVADLNGDGRNEVLVTTHGTVIKVLSPGYGQQIKGDFAEASKVGEVDLQTNSTVKLQGAHIVALAAGHLDPPPAELVVAARKQVLLAVTSNWHVFCLDHNLRLKWQASVLDGEAHKHAKVREVAVQISSHRLRAGDRGVVVVGGSTELGDPSDDEDVWDDELAVEQEVARLMDSVKSKDNLQDLTRGLTTAGADVSRHFSMYAFEGATGTPRWRHEGTDFLTDTAHLQEQTLPQHNHRLQAEHLVARHHGEASCRAFKESVLAHMPHRWDHRHDTSLELSHFYRHRGAVAAKRAFENAPGQAGSPRHGQGGAQDPSGAAEHHRGIDKHNAVAAALGKATAAMTGLQAAASVAEPNVWVAHLRDGIEAVELGSGRTVCKLHLASPGLHTDLDGDGVLDHVQASGGKETDAMYTATGHVHHERCWAAATSGVPPNLPLFNGSICRYNPMGSLPFGGPRFGAHDTPPLEVATPAALPLASSGNDEPTPKALAVFLNSRGEVTAYDTKGHKHWQNAFGLTWSNQYRQGAGHQVAPTLRAMQLRADAAGPHVLMAAGSHTAAILSPQGHQMEALSLPAAPVIPLQVTDFNSDGNNDIILLSRDGVYAFVQVRHIGGLPFTTLIGILLVAMAAVYITQIQPQGKKPGTTRGRSTDRLD